MDYNFLFILLSSSNSKLLKLSYYSIINQTNHNIKYNIILNINSLDNDYYNEVKNEFKDIDIEIIQTISNGKPGMGHNSCLEIFKNKIQYDYLFMIDGDDFLYPTFLSQISKAFQYKNNIDLLAIYGNDSLRTFQDSDISDLYLMNNFYLRLGHFLPKNFHQSTALKNPFTSDILKNGIITVIRILLYSRNFINICNYKNFYCNKCYILDDYIAYLNFINYTKFNNINSLIINSDGIYLYNNLNNNSVSNTYKKYYNDDYLHILSYKSQFNKLQEILGSQWNLDFIDFYQLSLPYNNEELVFSKNNNNNTYSINKTYFDTKKNYIFLIDFAKHIITNFYNNSINIIENYIFKNNTPLNQKKAYDLCIFFINNKVQDRRIFIYLCILYYYFKNNTKFIEYYNKSDYYIYKYKQIINHYKQII